MKKTGPHFIVNELQDDSAEMFLYGLIGNVFFEEGITSNDFVKALRGLEQKYSTIKVRINSKGGDVYEGLAIYNALKNSKATIHTYIDGIAASMASAVASAGSKVYMSKFSRLMTHKASTGAYGNADEIEEVVKLLKDTDNLLAETYASKTGCTVDEACEKYLNGKDQYFSAERAKKEGLIDDVYDAEPVSIPTDIKNVSQLYEIYNTHFEKTLFEQKTNPIILI